MTTRRRLPPQKLGSLIGAVFGLVFVVVNSASSPTLLRLAFCVAAAAVAITVLVGIARNPVATVPAGVTPFGRGYAMIVLAEVVLLFVGIRVVAGPLGLPEAGVAWVALVVGVHFVVLARLWHLRLFDVLGAVLTVLGVLGFVLAVAGSDRMWIDIVAGVASGAVLLEFARRGVRQSPTFSSASS